MIRCLRVESVSFAAASATLAFLFAAAAKAAETKTPPQKSMALQAEHVTARAASAPMSGGGLMTPQNGTAEISAVDRAYMDTQSPTANAFQLVSLLPGANVMSSDPSGLSPQTDIAVRGLDGSDLGYLLEGMPMADAAAGGGTPSQFADAENYQSVSLQQSGAPIEAPLHYGAGGTLSMHYVNPSEKPKARLGVSYGSFQTSREFIRLDSGKIGDSRIKSFVSYSRTYGKNWRGPGNNGRHHVDFKALRPLGNSGSIALVASWNRSLTGYYPKVTMQQWRRDGVKAGELAGGFNPGNSAGGSDYYKLYRDPENTFYAGAPITLGITRKLRLTLTPYGQEIYGNWPSGSQIFPSGNYQGTQPITDPFSLPVMRDGAGTVRSDWRQRTARAGSTLALHAAYGRQRLTFGYWYDRLTDHEQNSFVAVRPGGQAPDIWGADKSAHLALPNGALFRSSDIYSIGQTNAFFFEDRMDLLKSLSVSAGFKEVLYTMAGRNRLPGPQKHAGASYAVPLPRAGAVWRMTGKDQLFINGMTSYRVPAATAFYAQYNSVSYPGNKADGKMTGAPPRKLRAEYAISEEIGYRHQNDWFSAALTFFNYNFTNRQIASTIGAGYQTTINAGGQTSRGVDGAVGLAPVWGFSPYASFEYLDATIDSNIRTENGWLPTRGKKAVRSPRFMGSVGLRYDHKGFFGMITAHYRTKQYATFVNDESLPGYATADLALGYRGKNLGWLKKPAWRVNFSNLSSQTYLSGVGAPTLTARTSAPQYYIAGGLAVTGSLEAGF